MASRAATSALTVLTTLAGPAHELRAQSPPAEVKAAGSTRLFLAPTARTAPRGRGSVGLTEIAFPWVEVGLLERVSLQAFVVPPLVSSAGVILAPKLQLVGLSHFQAAAGVIQVFAEGGGGIGYGVVTLGSARTAVTAGYGYAYGVLADSSGSASIVFFGIEHAFSPGVRLIGEGYVGSEAMGMPEKTLLGGFRLSRGRWAVDLAAVVPFYETGAGGAGPLVTFTWGF